MEALKDYDHDVRRHAAAALGNLGDLRCTGALFGLVSGDRHRSVRCAAVCALAELGAGSEEPAVVNALADEDAYVRYAAAAFYDRVPAGPAAVDRLLAAAHDPLPHVQKAAVRALGRVEVAPASQIRKISK